MVTDRPQFWRLSRLTELLDVFSSYSGRANRRLAVNALETAIETPLCPPPGITSGWELIRTGTFTADINITGLNGNADRLWMLVITTIGTVARDFWLRFNGDIASNYSYHRHALLSGGHFTSITSSGSLIQLEWGGQLEHNPAIFIFSTTGKNRAFHGKNLAWASTTNFDLIEVGGVWRNTIDVIHTINIISGIITAGEFWLFRRRV